MVYDLFADDEAWLLVEDAAFDLAQTYAENRHKRFSAGIFEIDESCQFDQPAPALQCSNLDTYPQDLLIIQGLFEDALMAANLQPHNLANERIVNKAILSFLTGWYRGCQTPTPSVTEKV